MFQQLKVPSSKRFRSRGVSYYKICPSITKLQFQEFRKFFCRRFWPLPVCCKVPTYLSFRSFLVADTDLCLSVSKLQVTRVPEVFWSQILNSACPLQSYKLPEFQKFYGRRHLTLPVLCKVTSYQSSRSFMASNCDLYMSNSKFPSFESFKFPKLQIHPHILPLL